MPSSQNTTQQASSGPPNKSKQALPGPPDKSREESSHARSRPGDLSRGPCPSKPVSLAWRPSSAPSGMTGGFSFLQRRTPRLGPGTSHGSSPASKAAWTC
eukprot:3425348-Amphidinium_carterae.1